MTSVIVIDDSVDILEVLGEFLKIKGLNVIGTGTNGKDGIELYDKLHPDAVIMDVMMPDFDGFYGLEGIKKIDSDAIVIMITADLSEETRKKLNNLNATKIFYKPLDFIKIAPTIEKLVDEKIQSTKLQINN